MNAVVLSIGNLFSSGQFPATSEPDNAAQLYGKPTPDFVLCRDEHGNATAVYGEPIWDFNPYRLSAKKIRRIRFDTIFDNSGQEQQALIEEVKYLLYCIIYFGGGGRLGMLSAATLSNYFGVLRIAMQFCSVQMQKPMVGVLSLHQLFTVPVYLAAFIRERNVTGSLCGILNQLVRVGQERLGYVVLNPSSFDLNRPKSNQYPIIPTRIYLNLINLVGDLLNQIYQGIGSLESFISSFADDHYGININTQKSRGLGGRANYRSDMPQALREHGLVEVFANEFFCPHRSNLQRVLLQMQYVAKTVIHLYTGMRDQEVLRMEYNCLSEEVVIAQVVDDHNMVRDRSQTVCVLSTTTKFTGYRKHEAWFASSEVVKAVEVAQAVCRGLAKLYKVKTDDRCPLFLNPSILKYKKSNNIFVSSLYSSRRDQLKAFKTLRIQTEDLQELAQSDPSRDFYNEPNFAVDVLPLTEN